MSTLRSLYAWTAIITMIVLWLPVMAVSWLLDRDPARYRTGYLFRRLGAAMARTSPSWELHSTGFIPENPRLPYVVVANHQSMADIPLISTLPWEMKWVAKASLFKLPVAGWMLRLAGDIPVDRSNPASRADVLVRARQILDHKCSVMMMPEGTRTRDGRLKAFHDGAFKLAIEAGVPVLPIAIDGTANALPKHGWKIGEVRCRLHVLHPIPTHDLTPQDASRLREHVRTLIAAHIAAWREVPVDAVLGDPHRSRAEPSMPTAPVG
ncbi:lysophospholipid acyltransferase family protein [soil metagenome]